MCEADIQKKCPGELVPDEAQLLWDEYKYRHEHCWKTLFRLTAATVVMSIIPYLKGELTLSLGYWIASPPLLALALVTIGMLRIKRELDMFYEVKNFFHKRQNLLFGIHKESGFFNFRMHIWVYLWSLFLLGLANLLFLLKIWIPESVNVP